MPSRPLTWSITPIDMTCQKYHKPVGNSKAIDKLISLDNSKIKTTFISERSRSLLCCRSSVCRLSVTLVHPTQPVESFGNISMLFGMAIP